MEIIKILDRILLFTHIFFAFGSLVIFWIPVIAKKGGKLHNKSGEAYVISMWFVLGTALLLSIHNFTQGDLFGGVFLGFLAILTANPLWFGIAVLQKKKGLDADHNRKQMFFNGAVALTGLMMVALGLYVGIPNGGVLLIIFGSIGATSGLSIFKDLRNPPTESDWLFTHVRGMITSGIAAYTAFFAFGGRSFFEGIFDGYFMIIPWIAPTVIGVTALRILKRKYSVKYKKARG